MPYTVVSSYDESERPPITDSILLTTKKLLGIAEEYHAFDIDVINAVNAALFTLNQLGVGPKYPFAITGDGETYTQFLGNKHPFYNGIQMYVYMKTRLMFDPPTNSFLVKSFEDQCRELEWRFMVQPITDEDLPDRDRPVEEPDEPPIEPPEPDDPEEPIIPPEPDDPDAPITPPEPDNPEEGGDDEELLRRFS